MITEQNLNIVNDLKGIIRPATEPEIRNLENWVITGDRLLINKDKRIFPGNEFVAIIIETEFICLDCMPFRYYVITDTIAGYITREHVEREYNCKYCTRRI